DVMINEELLKKSHFNKIAAITYSIGVIFHTFRIIANLPSELMPFWLDGIVVIGATYGSIGLVLALITNSLRMQNIIDRLITYGILLQLVSAVVIHVYTLLIQSHSYFDLFPPIFNYLIVMALGLCAFFSWKLQFKNSEKLKTL
ncbi:MAG: hypothetical protein ACFFC7_18250, partial [Candidatus Hermodarchaeota archaeon]